MRAEPWLDEIRHGINQANSFGCDYCATTRRKRDVACWPILLKKSKIQRLRKSREGWFFVVSAAASVCRTGTRTYGRFCVNRCGPSHRRARDASAVLKNFVRQPKRFFQQYRSKSDIDPDRSLSPPHLSCRHLTASPPPPPPPCTPL